MLPLAPARLSTTTVCPSDSESGIATWRATKSSPPPAPDETSSLTGLLGYAPCIAVCAEPSGVSENRMAPRMVMDAAFSCISVSSSGSTVLNCGPAGRRHLWSVQFEYRLFHAQFGSPKVHHGYPRNRSPSRREI